MDNSRKPSDDGSTSLKRKIDACEEEKSEKKVPNRLALAP